MLWQSVDHLAKSEPVRQHCSPEVLAKGHQQRTHLHVESPASSPDSCSIFLQVRWHRSLEEVPAHGPPMACTLHGR